MCHKITLPRRFARCCAGILLITGTLGCYADTVEPAQAAATAQPNVLLADGAFAAMGLELPQTPVGEELRRYLALWSTTSQPDADQAARLTLLSLRQHPQEAAAALRMAYEHLPKERYSARWLVIAAAGDLQVETAVPLLSAVAASPMPALSGGHGGPYEEELVVRMRTLKALGDLAYFGSSAASDALRSLLSHADRAVRETAILTSIRASTDPAARRRDLAASLPARDRYVLDLRSSSHPREVVQPTPPAASGRADRPPSALPVLP